MVLIHTDIHFNAILPWLATVPTRVRQFDNCVECHRSADEDDIKGGKNRNGGKREDD